MGRRKGFVTGGVFIEVTERGGGKIHCHRAGMFGGGVRLEEF